jgi:hypothetical protein
MNSSGTPATHSTVGQPPYHPMKAPPITSPKKQIPSNQPTLTAQLDRIFNANSITTREKTMKHKTNKWPAMLCTITASMLFINSAAIASEAQKDTNKPAQELQVFILAGQSNMQGHATFSTLAYLPHPIKEMPWEKFKRETDGMKRALKFTDEMQKQYYEDYKKRMSDPKLLKRDKELAAIFTPGVTDEKMKAFAFKDASQLYRKETGKKGKNVSDGVFAIAQELEKRMGTPIAKNTHIAAFGGLEGFSWRHKPGIDDRRQHGALSIGYGAQLKEFGLEYPFGIQLEKKLDKPILIIKVSWGGRTLNYNFRPPSAGKYQPTDGEQKKIKAWENDQARHQAYIKGGGKEEELETKWKDFKNRRHQERQFGGELRKIKDKAEREKASREHQGRWWALDKEEREMVPLPRPKPDYFDAGGDWRLMEKYVKEVLANLGKYHPQYNKKAGYKVAGSIWFQGFNDQLDKNCQDNYAENMVHYVQDMRKLADNPKLPFVIGVMGMSGMPFESNQNAVSNGQRKAGNDKRINDYSALVESWPYTTPELAVFSDERAAKHSKPGTTSKDRRKVENEWQLRGSNKGYHYMGSGRFFIRFGDAIADAMYSLIQKSESK